MVILIGGTGLSGKTLLTKSLIKNTLFPALSQDHLKMGLIRAGVTELVPTDDEKLTSLLWPITAEMVKTAIENEQDLIIEGCYIPADWSKAFDPRYSEDIRVIFLAMTADYIREHYDRILSFAKVAEKRCGDLLSKDELIRDNEKVIREAKENGSHLILIHDRYDPEEITKRALALIRSRSEKEHFHETQ